MKSATAKSQSGASQVPSHLSRMSESKRARLEEIKKREQLKGMLITKFLKKYGQNQELKSFIDSQVQKFMSANRLTEGNLRELDEKILAEKEVLDKRIAVREQRQQDANQKDQVSQIASIKSQARSRPSTAKPASIRDNLDDLKSQHSKASKFSAIRNKPAPKRAADQESIITVSHKSAKSESVLDEEDEWAAIQKFNALLHFEEQKQTAAREAERKRLLKIELETQQQAKLEKIRKQK